MKKLTICIDFDGTCVTHEFPKIGKDIGAVPVLKRLVKAGHRLILWTMRSDIKETKELWMGVADAEIIEPIQGRYLTDAVNWFKDNDIPLFGINENPEQKSWTSSPKAYGHLYIDDAALGCPLIFDDESVDRPYVDWTMTEARLIYMGLI